MTIPEGEAVRSWIGYTLVDVGGETVGRIDDIYLDNETGAPEWALVKLEGRESTLTFIPLLEAREQDETIRVALARHLIDGAPLMAPDGQLSESEEAELYRHYGIREDRVVPEKAEGFDPDQASADVGSPSFAESSTDSVDTTHEPSTAAPLVTDSTSTGAEEQWAGVQSSQPAAPDPTFATTQTDTAAAAPNLRVVEFDSVETWQTTEVPKRRSPVKTAAMAGGGLALAAALWRRDQLKRLPFMPKAVGGRSRAADRARVTLLRRPATAGARAASGFSSLATRAPQAVGGAGRTVLHAAKPGARAVAGLGAGVGRTVAKAPAAGGRALLGLGRATTTVAGKAAAKAPSVRPARRSGGGSAKVSARAATATVRQARSLARVGGTVAKSPFRAVAAGGRGVRTGVKAALRPQRRSGKLLRRNRRRMKMGKMTMGLGFAAGYVLGSKAGEERYQQIAQAAQKFADRPEVRKLTDSLNITKEKAKTVASGKFEQATNKAADKVQQVGDQAQSGTTTSYTSSGTDYSAGSGGTGYTAGTGYATGTDYPTTGAGTSSYTTGTDYATTGSDFGTTGTTSSTYDSGFSSTPAVEPMGLGLDDTPGEPVLGSDDLGSGLPGESTSSHEGSGYDPTDPTSPRH